MERLAQQWLWWILSFIVHNMETKVSVYFQTRITQHERLIQFFCAFSFFSQSIYSFRRDTTRQVFIFHKMAYTLLDGDKATTVSEFQLTVMQIDTLVYRDAITIVSVTFPLSRTSPNGANPTYQLRILSIVCLNKQLWRSAISVYFVIRSTVFHLTSISESCVAGQELFTGRASFCLERPCLVHHWSCREIISESAVFISKCPQDTVRLFNPLLLLKHHCAPSAQFLRFAIVQLMQEDTLNTSWVRQGVVLYSLLLNLCQCFCFNLIPMRVHA